MGLRERLGFSKPLAFADENPRKVAVGTTQTTTGLLPVAPDQLKEIGSATVTQLREVVPALGARTQALLTYREMARSDAAVDVSLRAPASSILGADFYVEPYNDDPENIDIRDFIEYNLFDGMNIPFPAVLEFVLTFYRNGHSVVEKVFEQREWVPPRKGANRRVYTMLRKLAPRPATTIKSFTYDDNGGPLGIVQNAIDSTGKVVEQPIDIEKLIIFTIGKESGNLEGTSLLRTAYRHWVYKDKLYTIDAIQKERHALGVPYVKLPPGYSEDDKKFALELVKNVRANEEAGFVEPPGYEMGFKALDTQPVDVMPSIEHHNGMIMMNVMAQFLLLGLQDMGGGGRATSAAHTEQFVKSLRYSSSVICDCFNLYLIPQLVTYNWQTDKFPKLKVRNLGEGRDLQLWANAVSSLLSQGAITADLAFEQWVRTRIDAPTKLEDRPEPVAPADAPAGDPAQNGRGSVDTQSTRSGTGNTGKKVDEA